MSDNRAASVKLVCPKCDPPMFYQAVSGQVKFCLCGAQLVPVKREEGK
jgi:hypothetical protein